MSKYVHDDVLDEALNYIKTNASRMCVCSTQPTTYTQAITTYKLADVDISSSDFTGPANGDVSGRKLTVNEQAEVVVDTSGDASYVALVDTTDLVLLYRTTCPIKSIVAGNKVTIPAWDIELRDPT